MQNAKCKIADETVRLTKKNAVDNTEVKKPLSEV